MDHRQRAGVEKRRDEVPLAGRVDAVANHLRKPKTSRQTVHVHGIARAGDGARSERQFVDRCAAWMAARVGVDSPWRCWVAEASGAVVGQAWAQRIEKMPNPVDEPEVHVYVTNCYVVPGRRGHGLGGRLLDAALEWSRAIDADAVILWPSDRSRSLYLRRGFGPRDDVFELRR